MFAVVSETALDAANFGRIGCSAMELYCDEVSFSAIVQNVLFPGCTLHCASFVSLVLRGRSHQCGQRGNRA